MIRLLSQLFNRPAAVAAIKAHRDHLALLTAEMRLETSASRIVTTDSLPPHRQVRRPALRRAIYPTVYRQN